MEGVLDAFFRDDPEWAVRHHLDSYNRFVAATIPDLLATFNAVFAATLEGDDGTPRRVEVEMRDPRLDRPTLTPAQCRATLASYTAALRVDVTVRFIRGGKTSVKRFGRVRVGSLPVMLRSAACPLEGASPEEMAAAGESAADVGGYFVVGGREKVIITQEKFRANLLRTGRSSTTGRVAGLIYATGMDGESKQYPKRTNLALDAERRVTLQLVRFNDSEVPLHVMFRALGVESDREILDLVTLGGADEWAWMAAWLRPSLAVAGARAKDEDDRGVYTQEAALDALAARMRFRSVPEALKVLVEDLFPNQGPSFRAKAAFLAHVVRQLAAADTGRAPLTDPDAYAIKRLVTAGELLAQQFRNAFDIMRLLSLRALKNEYVFGAIRTTGRLEDLVRPDNLAKIFPPGIVDEYLARYMKGVVVKEGVATEKDGEGVVQELSRTNYLSTLSHLRRLHSQTDAALKMRSPRQLHVQQYGVVCPFETPDGGHIGLIKALAMLTRITAGTDDAPVRAALAEEGVVPLEATSPAGLGASTLVFLNGALLGACAAPAAVAAGLRRRRRTGALDRDVSVHWDVRGGELQVQCDEGRAVRPLVANPLPGGAQASSDAAVAAAAARLGWRWTALVGGLAPSSSGGGSRHARGARGSRDSRDARRGMVEYVDVDEGFQDTLVASTPAEATPRHTHVEIHPAGALSAVASLAPFLQHNQAPRNLYACGHAKQAIGVYATNFRHRVDAVAYVAWNAQLPLVTTRFRQAHGPAGARLLASGQNLTVAIMPALGFNQEDSIVLNRASVQRGALRVDVYKGLTESEGDGTSFANPSAMRKRGTYVARLHEAYYGALDGTGLPAVGTVVGRDDRIALLGRVGDDAQDGTVVSDRDLHGVVDLVQASGEPGARRVRIRLRQSRPPDLGDKLCSRFAQKGVVGAIVDPWHLPRLASGVTPDVFFNPHAFPSRMTVGHLLDTLMGKACAAEGAFGDGTPYAGTDLEALGDALEARGFSRLGDEVAYDAATGARLACPVFVGVTAVCRMKLMSVDKMHARAGGPKVRRTMQPAAGRGRNGGLRVGEMERDVMVSHGESGFLRESFMERSDKFAIAVCGRCGATSDGDRPCPVCRADPVEDAVGVECPYAFNVFRQELDAVGIRARLVLREDGAREPDPDEGDADTDTDTDTEDEKQT